MTTDICLGWEGPLDVDGALAFLRRRAVPGVEEAPAGAFRAATADEQGRGVVVELRPVPEDRVVVLRTPGRRAERRVGAARALFDLDADAAAIDRHLAGDAAIAPWVRRRPGTRVPGTLDGFELAVRAIVGQQVSVTGATTTLGRIAERFGEPLAVPAGSVRRRFPPAERLAEASDDAFGMPRARARAIVALARAVAGGSLDLSPGADRDRAVEGLAALPGVGPWTIAYVAMRALRDPDAFPVTDLGVRRGFEALGLDADPRAIAERAERWRPWRAYAVMHLWRIAAAATS
jgi:AraC family transcriptional regulator of adaptative response / DNA-3-methyladenine glycosylase II